MNLSQRQKEAIAIVKNAPDFHIGTVHFAALFWPEKTLGRVSGMRAGQYLARLSKTGLVKKQFISIRGNIMPDGYKYIGP